MPEPPEYTGIHLETEKEIHPPQYSPGVRHLSLCFVCDELTSSGVFNPVVLEINSTQLNLFSVQHKYLKYALFYGSKLLPEYIDPNLNIKLQEDEGEREEVSRVNSSVTSPTKKPCKFGKRLINRFKIQEKSLRAPIELTIEQQRAPKCRLVHELLNFKPNLHTLIQPIPEDRLVNLNLMKHELLNSYSMQELIQFGNAVDFLIKPFTLRLIFPCDQFLITSYTSKQFIQLFHKLNFSKEISLDLENRLINPKDYCVPIRINRRTNRDRSNTVSSRRSTRPTTTTNNTTTAATPSNYHEEDDYIDTQLEHEMDEMFPDEEEEEVQPEPQPSQRPSMSTDTNRTTTDTTISTSEGYDNSLFSGGLQREDTAYSNHSISKNDEPYHGDHLTRQDILDYKELIYTLRCMNICRTRIGDFKL